MPSEWNRGTDHYPEWSDDGRAIEVFVTDEIRRSAKLSAEDTWFDGDSEVHIWFVRFESGQRTELVAIPRWRFV